MKTLLAVLAVSQVLTITHVASSESRIASLVAAETGECSHYTHTHDYSYSDIDHDHPEYSEDGHEHD